MKGAPDAAVMTAPDSAVAIDAAPDASVASCDRAAQSMRCEVGYLCAASATCWSAAIDCSSTVDCDGDGKLDLACPCGQRASCATRSCGATPGAVPPPCARPAEDARCSEDLPYLCANQNSCVADPNVDCASLRDCDVDGVFESTCGCGLAVDCTTRSCRAMARGYAPTETTGGNSEEDRP